MNCFILINKRKTCRPVVLAVRDQRLVNNIRFQIPESHISLVVVCDIDRNPCAAYDRAITAGARKADRRPRPKVLARPLNPDARTSRPLRRLARGNVTQVFAVWQPARSQSTALPCWFDDETLSSVRMRRTIGLIHG